jgi:hypothetical protein
MPKSALQRLYGPLEAALAQHDRMLTGKLKKCQKLCPEYLQGACPKGDSCFKSRDREVSAKFRRFCSALRTGRCPEGDDCDYSHAIGRKYGRLCIEFVAGLCDLGDDCACSHDLTLAQSPADVVNLPSGTLAQHAAIRKDYDTCAGSIGNIVKADTLCGPCYPITERAKCELESLWK